MATQSPPTSRLLSLPKELRILIYESLYPMDFTSNRRINLTNASHPTKALLLTCAQIHHESASLYKASYRAYWSTSNFLLTPDPQTPRATILALPMREMQHMKHLRVLSPGLDFTAWLVHPNGGWGLISREEGRSFRRYRRSLWRPHSKAESVVVPTKAAWDGHKDEEDLRRTCERIRGSVAMVNQVLDLLGLELVDLEGVWQTW